MLLAGGLTLLLLGATQGGIRGWGDVTSWVPLASGAALLAAYTAWAARTDQPAPDLSLARYGPSALAAEQLGDASTLINVWQRIAGSFGIGLIAALFTQQARAHGPVPALHTTGLLIAALSAAGLLAVLPLPAIRNTALTGAPGGPTGPGGPGTPGSPHATGPRRAAPGP